MIVWLNGTFGAGKTQTAWEMCRRLPGAFVYDPELAGQWLRRCTPKARQQLNFQDEPLWPQVNHDLLHQLDDGSGVILVLMTLTNAAYYDQIIGRLESEGHRIHHVVLWAEERIIRQRLRKRLEFSGSWGAQQLPACLAAFSQPPFDTHIATARRSVPAVAEAVAAHCGLSLSPRAARLHGWLQRVCVQWRAIR